MQELTENVVPHGHLIHLTVEFPINQIPNPDQLVWYFEEYDVINAKVLVKSLGQPVHIDHS
jgi:hypothetical protein